MAQKLRFRLPPTLCARREIETEKDKNQEREERRQGRGRKGDGVERGEETGKREELTGNGVEFESLCPVTHLPQQGTPLNSYRTVPPMG